MTNERYAVWTHEGWLGTTRGRDYGKARTRYEVHQEPQKARVWFRKTDASRACQGYPGATVVPVKLWFGPYPVPADPMTLEHRENR